MSGEAHHRVLILGAGLVSRPIVRDLLSDPRYRVTVASLFLDDARALVDTHPRGHARAIDVTDTSQLAALIGKADLVVSLVPYAFHVQVAETAIARRIHVVTASYVQPEMRALHERARQAGVTVLNEVGLDPGIDHMSAMRMIDAVRDAGGRITEFRSCCGGIPAPEAANNPWRYKFSWSPRGALLAAKLSARYLHDGRVFAVPADNLFLHGAPYEVEGVGGFEIYPNRDSLHYIDAYGLRDVRSMLRATIRYPGWCETMQVVSTLGLLDVNPRRWPQGTTYAAFLSAFLPQDDRPLRDRLAAHAGVAPDHAVVERLVWAGLLEDDPIVETEASPLDIIAARFAERMKYGPEERDMVVLRHDLVAAIPGSPPQRHVSLLVAHGEPGGDSATSRTVSLPAAVATRLILDGEIRERGVHIPTSAAIYRPILERLEQLGIAFREWRKALA